MQAVRQQGIATYNRKATHWKGVYLSRTPPRSCEAPILGIMNKLESAGMAGTQADAAQQLTSPVETARFATPTMTFGEVGVTEQTKTPGQAIRGHGLGEFSDTQLLERSVLLTEFDWTTTSFSLLYFEDIMQIMKNHPRIKPVLDQFRYFRADIETTVRLNTNQFYTGALMITQFPGNDNITGNWIDERSVLNPVILSASSAESAILDWEYGYPDMWLPTGVDSLHPVSLVIDALFPLHQCSPSIPDRVRVSVWSRLKNVKLAYPYQIEAQSSSVSVKKGAGTRVQHPADDPGTHASGPTVGSVVSAIKNTTIGEAVDFVEDAIGAIGSLFDKPERTDPQYSTVIEASTDLFAADIADSSVTLGMYKDRYLDPARPRIPMSKDWTISQFAQIPTLKGLYQIFPNTDEFYIEPMETVLNEDQLRSMLEYAQKNAVYWRGSLKVCFQFFTSAFTTSRFAIQVINQKEFPGGNSQDYTGGLSAVVNVKGDTIHKMTIPWNSRRWWEDSPYIRIYVNRISPIVSTIDGADPRIYMAFWVAGGDDIQFAYPRLPTSTEWGYRPFALSKREHIHAQCSIQKEFAEPFQPIVMEAVYDYDDGLCTNEQLGLITDIAKRYGPLFTNDFYTGNYFYGDVLDRNQIAPESSVRGGQYAAFRNTFFGMWRAAFFYRGGGFHFRQTPSRQQKSWVAGYDEGFNGTLYVPPYDETTRLSIPQVMENPFGMRGLANGQLGITTITQSNGSFVSYIAARDDVQFGYPILPQGIIPAPINGASVQKEVVKKRS